ncbi:MAG: bifunctional 5,10-methylenetetrahydrofolate dehydrogenase/5,10-methenyltetrahydrofolate cyclohydrolase [Candidatus Parcubacteria bacterium]|nr:bifunctional 5,10-methylenetetrahydrofolate dehydrogenase/5,10-methenyltetrahydrofolate cyclohydrolase [Candidatus Parcubacteria bacterium]
MPAQLLNGKIISDRILSEVKAKVATMDYQPGLAAILVGDNESSKLYLKLKEKACLETDIQFHTYFLDAICAEDKIIEVIDFLNKDPETTGILLQLPLPAKFDTHKLIQAINPQKDIDGFHPDSPFTSPTALGIVELLKETKTDLKNKNVIILSNSEEFAEPFKKLLPDSKVEYINPKLQTFPRSGMPLRGSDFGLRTLTADVLIVAIGQANCIKPDMIKKDAILIDVGISKVDGKTIGDIDPSCDKVASWRSPVPGGVGPLTVAMLLHNLVKNAK